MADISRIKIGENEALNIKDATGRSNVSTLVGSHGITALGDAAWKGVATAIASTSTNNDLATAKSVYDAIQGIGKALHFVGVATKLEGKTELESVEAAYPAASQTEGAIAVCGIKEFIVYGTPKAWHEFGEEGIYLSKAEAEANYVKKILTIAGIDLADNISVAELQSALTLGQFAYANTGSGSLLTVDSASDITVAKPGEYSVTGTAVSVPQTFDDLSITPTGDVTITPETAAAVTYSKATGATLSATESESGNYTPAGSVTLPTYSSVVTPSKESVATVTNSGTSYSLTDGSVSKGTDSTENFATEGMIASIDDTDNELLVFTSAGTSAAVTSSAEPVYVAPTLSGSLPTFGTKEVLTGASVATTANGGASFSGTKVQLGASFTYDNNAAASVTQPTFTAEFGGDTQTVGIQVATSKNAAPSDAKVTVGSENKSITLNKTTKNFTVTPDLD